MGFPQAMPGRLGIAPGDPAWHPDAAGLSGGDIERVGHAAPDVG